MCLVLFQLGTRTLGCNIPVAEQLNYLMEKNNITDIFQSVFAHFNVSGDMLIAAENSQF